MESFSSRHGSRKNNNFDDFLEREKYEQEDAIGTWGEGGGGDEIPVLRSVDVMGFGWGQFDEMLAAKKSIDSSPGKEENDSSTQLIYSDCYCGKTYPLTCPHATEECPIAQPDDLLEKVAVPSLLASSSNSTNMQASGRIPRRLEISKVSGNMNIFANREESSRKTVKNSISTKPSSKIKKLEPVDDLFALLEKEFTNTALPNIDTPLCGVAGTSVVMECPLPVLASIIMNFLNSRGVHHQHCALSSLWKCEKTDLVDRCKFNIQVYSNNTKNDISNAYTVEFLRINGCCRMFLDEFQHFKSCRNQESDPKETRELSKENKKILSDVSNLATLAEVPEPQKVLESFLNWFDKDEAEAVSALCGIWYSHKPSHTDSVEHVSPLLNVMTQTASTGEYSNTLTGVIAILASVCWQFCERGRDRRMSALSKSSFAELSLLHLLLTVKKQAKQSCDKLSCFPTLNRILCDLIDSLIPSAINIASEADSELGVKLGSSICERNVAKQIVEMIEGY